MNNYNEGCQKLAAAIVKGVIVDYRKAKANLKVLVTRGTVLRLTNQRKYDTQRNKYIVEMETIEQFILSPHFEILTSTNPELLLKTLREEGDIYGRKKLFKSGTLIK